MEKKEEKEKYFEGEELVEDICLKSCKTRCIHQCKEDLKRFESSITNTKIMNFVTDNGTKKNKSYIEKENCWSYQYKRNLWFFWLSSFLLCYSQYINWKYTWISYFARTSVLVILMSQCTKLTRKLFLIIWLKMFSLFLSKCSEHSCCRWYVHS